MTNIEQLKAKYREYLREGEEAKATEAWIKLEEARSVETESEPEIQEKDRSFEELNGVGDEIANVLADEYDSVEDLADATPEDLEPISGIGEKRAESLIEQARE